jgi:iron complex transport system ATP-binding protein
LAGDAFAKDLAVTTLVASDLVVRRDGRSIVQGVSLSANAGEFIAVVGANGAGKSTLLATLAGLLKADAGRIELNGTSIAQLSGTMLARTRAYLPQNARCEWPISVERLVALGLTPTLPVFGGFTAVDQSKITRALETCDLLAQREQPATSLSGGELARAMLARAFVSDPALLIVDEPVAGLDPSHALRAMRRLRSFATEGRLVIASMHDLTLAARYATRIIALRHGRVECDGPMDGLTPDLIRAVFEIEARVLGSAAQTYIDYLDP